MPDEPAPVLASHSTAKRSAKKKQRKQRVRKARIGTPPPLAFDLLKVPGTALLSVLEIASAVRRSAQTVRLWRAQPDHPIKFRLVDGRPMATVADVIAYLNTPQQCSRTNKRK